MTVKLNISEEAVIVVALEEYLGKISKYSTGSNADEWKRIIKTVTDLINKIHSED